MRGRTNFDPAGPPRTTTATPARREGRRRPAAFALLLGLWMLASPVAAQEGASEQELRGIVGEEITIPCEVGPKDQCGDMHSVKWYLGDSRIGMYNAEDGQTALSGTFQPNRATFLANENPPVLRISKIELSDEGTFRCDVTYTQLKSGCPVVTSTPLKTLAIPHAPEIDLEQDGEEGDNRVTATLIGPFHEDEFISLTCVSGGGKPPAKVSWWKDNQSLGGFFSEELDADGTGTGQNIARVKVTRSDLLARYTCRVNHETLETRDTLEGAFVAWVEIDVFVPPQQLEFKGDDAAFEKETVSMTCSAKQARPAATISWFNGSQPISDLPPMVVDEQKDGTFVSTSTLTFTVSRFDDEEVFSCQAANQAMDGGRLDPLKDSATLSVFYPPVVRVVPAEEVLDIAENATLRLECLFEANPANESSFLWMRDGKALHLGTSDDDGAEAGEGPNGANKESSVNEAVSSDDKEGRYVLVMANISRQQAGNYSCMVTNIAGSGRSENQVTVDVVYPPEVHFVISPTEAIIEHETNVTLTCKIEDANPPEVTSVRWYRDDEVFIETDETILELPQVDRTVHRNYSCQAENRVGWSQRADPILINVLYTPGRAEIVHEPRIAIKGEPLTLFCELDSLGNPPATDYMWKQGDFNIVDVTTRNWSMGITSLQMQDKYECMAKNEAGEGRPATLRLDVSAPPAFIDSLLPKHGALETATEIALTCQVECEPRCSIEWLRNDEVLRVRSTHDEDEDNDMEENDDGPSQRGDYYSVKVSHLSENLVTGHFASVVSSLRWNMTAWPNGRLDRVLDMANYTCRSTPNLAGPAVVNTTQFQVEYPPENIKLSTYHLAIPEGEKSAPVFCSADGLPKVDFMWTYGDEVVSSTNELKLDFAASRHRVGQFVCTASNDHGKVNASVTLDVLYEPECSLVAKMDSEVGTVLSCEVVANPPVVDFQWFVDNETVEEHVHTDGTVSRLSHVRPGGRYTCLANNSLGLSEPCILPLEGADDALLVSGFADNRIIIIVIVVAAVVIIAVIIAIIIILVMKRRSAVGKYSNRMDLEQRENPEGHAHPDAKKPKPGRKPGVVTFKRVESESAARATDSQADKRRSDHPMGPVSDGDRAFYENLPFHGLQPAPNKDFNERPVPAPRDYSPTKMRHIYQNLLLPLRALKPFKPTLPDLEYADVDFPPQGTESDGTPQRPPRAGKPVSNNNHA